MENHIHIPVPNTDSTIVHREEYEELILAWTELQGVYALIKTLDTYHIKDAVACFRENLHGTEDKEEANAE